MASDHNRLHDTPPHAWKVAETYAHLGTTERGLPGVEAAERLRRHGANRLTQRRTRGPLRRFLSQFHNVLIYVLLGSAAITALLQHWVDTGVILGVVVINALVGFVQEGKAERALEAIRRMLSPQALVLRDGSVVTIAAEQVVPGDVVLLQSGDRVPADLRLVRTKNLRIDEASLTGESVSVEKDIEPLSAQTAMADRRCLAFAGTFVTYGQGAGVVVATGDRTELGLISGMLAQVKRLETPLLRNIAVFSRWLSFAILSVAAFVFVIGVTLRGYTGTEMFMAAVGLAVAAIPEGLPAVITIALAIGVQRMTRRNAIIRLLPAVEALGSVTCICSDKTGTLTRNEMTVQSVATADGTYGVTGVGYAPHGEFLQAGQRIDPEKSMVLREALRAALLCNDAGLRRSDDGQWLIDGDPTEAALVVAAVKFGFETAYESKTSPRTDVIPFESEHRFMATLHHDHAGHAFIYLKGAPERVLDMCRYERIVGEDRTIDRDEWRDRLEAMAAEGQRVLACAFKPARPEDRDLDFDDVDDGLTLLALFGMVDPPREEAIRAVAACHTAGIRVKMITGDHAATARAIAARLGIGDGRAALTGVELQDMRDAVLREVVADVDVYARVSPEHKLRLVTALQARGEVVAMTGDGVNDAPALKRADIGVAMGITGTEVAKEAAEMVLADDNFASIANAVEEGRTVYDNLRKTILFILPTNLGEALSLVVAIALGMVLPILPVQILWVNMVTAVTLSLALAFEPTETDTMRRPPRDPRAPIFSPYFLWRTMLVSLILVAGTLGMFVWEQAQGATLEAARTAAVNTLVTFEVFYLINTRYLLEPAWPHRAFSGNPYVPLTIGLIVLAQLLYTYAPFMQVLFHTTAIDPGAWLRIVSIAASIYVIVELEKVLARRLGWHA